MSKNEELIAFLFDGRSHLLAGSLRQWMEASPRFATFVETYRDKIRKKVRVIQQPESLLDLHSELEAAYRLLDDRRLVVAYEPYASEKRRGPDFAVTYRVNQVFNFEVARIRTQEDSPANLAYLQERILRILLDKLGQMQPGMPNLLAIHISQDQAKALDLDKLMREIKTRADGKDPSFYITSRRYDSPASFYKDFTRLSGILLWAGEVQVWINRQARPALEEKIVRLASALLSGEDHVMKTL